MRKLLSIIILSLCVASCSKNDSPKPEMNETVKEIWQTLKGTYAGQYTSFGNPYQTEEITFSPYTEPKEILPLYEKKCLAYGSAYIKTESASMVFDGEYYYSIDVKYSGAIPTISFYEYSIDDGYIINKEDKRNIRLIDATSIKMWSYGLTEDGSGNAVIYTKQ